MNRNQVVMVAVVVATIASIIMISTAPKTTKAKGATVMASSVPVTR